MKTEYNKMDAVAAKDVSFNSDWEFVCEFEVDFESVEKAQIVQSTLAVDKELQPDKVRREMCVSLEGKFSVRFEATEARFLRASFSSFLDNLTLATKTIEQFGSFEPTISSD